MTREDRAFAFLGIKSKREKLNESLKSQIEALEDRISDTTEALKQGYGSPSEIKEWRNDNKVDKLKLIKLKSQMQ